MTRLLGRNNNVNRPFAEEEGASIRPLDPENDGTRTLATDGPDGNSEFIAAAADATARTLVLPGNVTVQFSGDTSEEGEKEPSWIVVVSRLERDPDSGGAATTRSCVRRRFIPGVGGAAVGAGAVDHWVEKKS